MIDYKENAEHEIVEHLLLGSSKPGLCDQCLKHVDHIIRVEPDGMMFFKCFSCIEKSGVKSQNYINSHYVGRKF